MPLLSIFISCVEILTSTIGTKDEAKGRLVRKAKVSYDPSAGFKIQMSSSYVSSIRSHVRVCVFNFQIEILLCKSENFNSIMSSKKSERPKPPAEEEIKV
jgi:hypothetical protein